MLISCSSQCVHWVLMKFVTHIFCVHFCQFLYIQSKILPIQQLLKNITVFCILMHGYKYTVNRNLSNSNRCGTILFLHNIQVFAKIPGCRRNLISIVIYLGSVHTVFTVLYTTSELSYWILISILPIWMLKIYIFIVTVKNVHLRFLHVFNDYYRCLM
jgi:hypothetical protein